MRFSVEWIEINSELAKQPSPSFLFQRELPASAQGSPKGNLFNTAEVARVGKWLVGVSPMLGEPRWAIVQSGEFVRVPIIQYKTKARSQAMIWGTGLQVGMTAVSSVPSNYIQEIKETKLILGTSCIMREEAYYCYLGIAIRVE